MKDAIRKTLSQVNDYFYFSFRSFYSFGFFCIPEYGLSMSPSNLR